MRYGDLFPFRSKLSHEITTFEHKSIHPQPSVPKNQDEEFSLGKHKIQYPSLRKIVKDILNTKQCLPTNLIFVLETIYTFNYVTLKCLRIKHIWQPGQLLEGFDVFWWYWAFYTVTSIRYACCFHLVWNISFVSIIDRVLSTMMGWLSDCLAGWCVYDLMQVEQCEHSSQIVSVSVSYHHWQAWADSVYSSSLVQTPPGCLHIHNVFPSHSTSERVGQIERSSATRKW